MILGEAFQVDAPFDFGNATTLNRVKNIVPAIVTHRLAAPPEEVYSLHRKVSLSSQVLALTPQPIFDLCQSNTSISANPILPFSFQMAGVFLLCTRLKCNMNIKHIWDEIWSHYEFGRPDLPATLAQNSGADVKSVSGKK